jgi:hypothetical protein
VATLFEPCTVCGGQREVQFGDRVGPMGLTWSMSKRCRSCNDALEVDDYGPLPPDFRQAVIVEGGEWTLRTNAVDRVALMNVVKEAFKTSLAEAQERVGDLRGTRAEMEWLKELMRRRGLTGEVVSLAEEARGRAR